MFKQYQIKANNVRSLCWSGDTLVDWVAGGYRYSLNGENERPGRYYAYSFDAAVVSLSGLYAVIYTKNQTKGLLLKNGEHVREINRSYYSANAYDYPVTFVTLATGKEVLIHCPAEYCRLDIEDIETGELLSSAENRDPADFFHSRLKTSPNGLWLMSAGWVWHPLDLVNVYDLDVAIEDPTVLDNATMSAPGHWEVSSAAFLNDTQIFVTTSNEFLGDEISVVVFNSGMEQNNG